METLRIVSWNIWAGVNLHGIIECLKASEADVICLQEAVRDEGGNNDVTQQIAEALGFNWVFESTRTLTPAVSHLLQEHGIKENKEWGNAIISRYAIKSHALHLLSEKNRRAAMQADVEIKGSVVSVFSTHLVHGIHSPEIREGQVDELLRILPKNKAILAGDFNAEIESREIRKIREELTLAHQVTGKEIDHIFVSKDMRVVSAGSMESDASDHVPVYAVVEF